ncbi:hypothetical protein E2C01_031876 [Portunus trituberculatus]|uniref:Uncharacterized protein n=1 Tax=Portunus trituberculatus TaxID=210409 RepID=A0A5B7ETZ1_PORTR|nr:hypothetical protein [Portunus trituberculatus]
MYCSSISYNHCRGILLSSTLSENRVQCGRTLKRGTVEGWRQCVVVRAGGERKRLGASEGLGGCWAVVRARLGGGEEGRDCIVSDGRYTHRKASAKRVLKTASAACTTTGKVEAEVQDVLLKVKTGVHSTRQVISPLSLYHTPGMPKDTRH